MKLTAILLLSASLGVSAAGNSQVTLDLKNVPVQKVFKEASRQTGISIIYNEEAFKDFAPISISVKNASINEVLNKCLQGQPFEYSLENNVIVIKQKRSVTLSGDEGLTAMNQLPPPIDITGKVTDPDGNPLVNATISVRGTKITTKTDDNGSFTLKGIDENATLEISFVGYQSITIPVNKRTSIIASLKVEVQKLEEIIVNKGYYTEKQRFTLGNSVQITAKDIEKSPVQNPMLALQGRVTGMEITQLTGLNGGGIKLKIQGQNSINNSNNPLVVIDGVQFPAQLALGVGPNLEGMIQGGSPLNYINPNDIESITILKDADATSIYGSRAANGAILIITKKGKSGKTRLSINLQQGWGQVGHFVDMMNTRQYLDMRYEAYRNNGTAISTLTPDYSNYDLTFWDTTRYTNWQKTLIGGTAHYSNFQAGVSGGTTNMSYLVGATYNRQTTVFPGDFDNKAGNLHFNINASSPNQRFKMQLTGSYMYNQNHLPGVDLTSKALTLEPDAPALFNSDGTLNWALDANGFSTWGGHPLAYVVNSDFVNTTKNLVSSLNLNYRVFSGLDFGFSAGYNAIQQDLYFPNRLDVNEPRIRLNSTRSAAFGTRSMSGWNFEPQLKYQRKLGKGDLNALLGTTIQQNNYSYFQIVGNGFVSDLVMKSIRAATSTNITQSVSGITRFNALFGWLSYNWDKKYLMNLTFRRDGSNKFGPKARFHNFGSIAAGWIFTEEKWISKKLPFLSFGKLKSSYGTTGSDGIPDFAYLSIYNINNPTILYQGSIGLGTNNLPNPHLQWEDTHKWQAGLELGLLKDRIRLEVNHTRNISFNQLVSMTLPTVTGYSAMNRNQEYQIRNTSWEFMMNTAILQSKNLSWNTSINLTIPRNEKIKVPESASLSDKATVGLPVYLTSVAKFWGVNPANGGYLYLDKNGTIINSDPVFADRNIYVSTFSRYYGGVSNSVQYKDFQIDFLVAFNRIKGPRDMYFYNGTSLPGSYTKGAGSNQPVSVLSHWQKPGDNSPIGSYALYPIVVTNAFTTTDAWYSYESSFIKLKNVSLSWHVPSRWVNKARLQNVKLYANAQNLFTITKYRGLDPETGIGTLPPLRMITTGVSIEF